MSEQFRALFEASPLPTVITRESDGRILLVNQSWLELLGCSQEAVVGRTVDEIRFWARPERRAEIAQELRRGRRVGNLEADIVTSGGETLTALISISAVELDREPCLLEVFQDVTERRRHERVLGEREENIRQVTETAHQGFLLRDVNPPATLYASQAVAEIFGLTRVAVDENPLVLETLIHPDDRDAVLSGREGMTAVEDYEFRIVRPGGETRWVRTRAEAVRIEDGRVTRVAEVITDVSEKRARNQAPRASEEGFRMLVGSVTDYAIIMLDPEGRVTGWNPGAERIKGYTAAEIIGRDFSVFYPPEQVEAGHPQRELESAIATGHYQEEGERVRKDGTRFWADVTLTPIYDGGRLRGFAKVTRDITERREILEQLQDSEERFRMLAEYSTDVMTRSSADAILRYVSPASRELYGYAPEEMVGHGAWEYIHPEDQPAVEQAARALRSRGGHDRAIEYRARRKDGTYVWVDARVRMVSDAATGEPLAFHTTTRDISERKRAEVEIRRARAAADRANSAKSEFLSRVSHELRTPLHAILGFGELLSRDELAQDQLEKLDQLTRSARYLLQLIDEVLDLSRIERGELRLSLEPVHLGEIVRETLDMVLPLAAGRAITITAPGHEDLDLHVLADRHRVKQVLLNLLSNAVKYNREDGEISVRAAQGGSRVRLEVADTGTGIPAHALPRVFEPFDRLGAETTAEEGTGLGLALSKRLTEAMHGNIGIDSELGVGTTAWIELPVVAAPAVPRERPPSERPLGAGVHSGRPATVLYVEDNPANIKLVEIILAARPHVRLMVATQGGLAIELAREHRPELILLDLNLPDISGEEVLRRVRGDAHTAEIPVVITSADATPGQVGRMRRAGAAEYLTKPFGVEPFLAVIDAAAAGALGGNETEPPPAALDRGAIEALHELASKPSVGETAIRQLVDTYLADAFERCSGIELAIGAGDLDEVERQAHALGGASGWAGATEVMRRCRELEERSRQGDAEGFAPLAAGLTEAMISARAALKAEFGSPAAEPLSEPLSAERTR
jgi:PAS domain S-box-containing protein